jgi:hypothetical protein
VMGAFPVFSGSRVQRGRTSGSCCKSVGASPTSHGLPRSPWRAWVARTSNRALRAERSTGIGRIHACIREPDEAGEVGRGEDNPNWARGR